MPFILLEGPCLIISFSSLPRGEWMIVLENFQGEFRIPPRSLRKKDRSVGREQLNVALQQQIDFAFCGKLKNLFSWEKCLLSYFTTQGLNYFNNHYLRLLLWDWRQNAQDSPCSGSFLARKPIVITSSNSVFTPKSLSTWLSSLPFSARARTSLDSNQSQEYESNYII